MDFWFSVDALCHIDCHYLEDTIQLLKWQPKFDALIYLEDEVDIDIKIQSVARGNYEMRLVESEEYSQETLECVKQFPEGMICLQLIEEILLHIDKTSADTGGVLIFLPCWTAFMFMKRDKILGNKQRFLWLALHS